MTQGIGNSTNENKDEPLENKDINFLQLGIELLTNSKGYILFGFSGEGMRRIIHNVTSDDMAFTGACLLKSATVDMKE